MTTNQPGSRRQSVEQERAAYAWNKINEVQGSNFEEKYHSRVRGLGAMIMANGLGPSLAFLYAKAKSKNEEADGGEKKACASLLHHIIGWLVEAKIISLEAEVAKTDTAANRRRWMKWIGEAKPEEYRRARAETLAILLWLKRFAEGTLKDENVTITIQGGQDVVQS